MSLQEDRFDDLLSRIETESQRTAIKAALISSPYENEKALQEYVAGATKVEMIQLLQTEIPSLNNRMAGTLAGLLVPSNAQLQQNQQFADNSTFNASLQQKIDFIHHELINRIPKVIDTFITPSEFAKTSHNDVFLEVLNLCGFGNERLDSRVEKDLESLELNNRPIRNDLDYRFNFNGQVESDSYEPLQQFLKEKNIHVRNVTSGKGLVDGIVFNQELWTLKKYPLVPSNTLGPFEQCICKFIIKGRTDFIRLADPKRGVTQINNQYFIEIKVGQIGEVELKEAFYQLIGGNAGNPYRSPPVLITNLAASHYVLFISFIGDEENLAYQLNIFKFPSFGQAINYLEDETREANSCTRDFLRRKTPLSSPIKTQRDEEELSEFESKVTLETVVNDEDFDIPEMMEMKGKGFNEST